jgi:hypothetical protein
MVEINPPSIGRLRSTNVWRPKKKFRHHTIGNKMLSVVKLVVIESILSLIVWGQKFFEYCMIGDKQNLIATSLATKCLETC